MKNYLQLKFGRLFPSLNFDLTARSESIQRYEIKSDANYNPSFALRKSLGLFLFITFFGFIQNSFAQLNKGDIAFTSFNADEDGFSLVTFVNIPANTTIYFTDNEATGTTAFNSGESYFQWATGGSIINAGSVIRFSSTDTTSLTASRGTLTRATVSGNTNYGFSNSGDALYAFIGSSATAPTTILTAISSGDTVSPGDVITNAGLTTGTNAIVIRTSADYGEYNGSRSGQASFANYKALVLNVTNWTVDQNDGNYASTVPNTTAFTIAAVTPTVNLSVNTNTGAEAGTTVITVTATASSAVSGNQTVSLGVSGTNITSGDYSLSNTTITLLNGQTAGSVTFTVTDDALIEGTETANLTISNPSSGLTLGSTLSQSITITDNDVPPIPTVSLSVSANSGTEAGITAITVTATASLAVSGNQTVNLGVSGTNITSGDYSLSNTVITILSGQTTGSVTFTVTDDALVEGPETAALTISSPTSGITLGTPITQSIAVTDNDSTATIDLSTYVRIGRYDLPEPTRTAHPTNNLLCQEASAVTYDWDTDTLFITGDGSTAIVQVSKTGQLINSMTMAQGSSPQGTDFYDTEGITYIGNGQFVMSEERDRQLVKFTYAAGTTLTRSNTQTVKIGTFVNNTGTEGLSYDPLTGGFICLKEIDPIGIFQTNVDFNAGTATNGSATTENSVNLFNPSLLGMSDVADVFALSNLPSLNGQSLSNNLLVLSQEAARVVNVDRNGVIANSLQIVTDPGNPLSAAAQQHEGLTMDRNGILYVVSENGGGDIDHPQLWVYAPSTAQNQAPTAVALANTTTSVQENTSTATAIKVADIVVTDDGLGTNNLTLSGADANFFQITNSSLYIKAGVVLDFETKTTYNVTINVDDTTVGATPDAFVTYTLNVTDVVNETPQLPTVTISEVAPWGSGNSPVGADWFEVTNNGATTLNISGWKVDDNSNSFASAIALTGITSIAPGESVIFMEATAANPASTIIPAFKTLWFGNNPPASLQIGTYQGSGIGLGTGGDALNLYDGSGTLQANVIFGTSPTTLYKTFNNAAALNNVTITLLSEINVNDAFAAINDTSEIGSPGSVGRLFISEVAPWASSNSPVAADWFEVTNTKAIAVDITGWKMDDNSQSPVAAVALSGITSINPGESVIFIETNDLAGKTTAFLNNWFGTNPSSGIRIGNYTGSGVGLGSGGDQVNLYNGSGTLQTSVLFGTSPTSTFATFDNKAGLNSLITPVTQLSAVGINGAFIAANSVSEIGSPGTIFTAPCPTITATATPAAATVCTGSNTTVSVIATGGTTPYTITGSPLTVGGGTFTYTITDAKGCTTTATATVATQALPASAGSNGNLSICSTTTLTTAMLFNALTGTPATGGTWTPALAGAGTYTYTQAAIAPCTVNNTATVTVSVVTALTWYEDLDGDGYGSSVSQLSCSNLAPAYSLTGGDCDDTTNSVNPSRTEICYNNIDDNCNGAKSEGCAPVIVNMTPSYNNTTLPSLSTAIPAVAYTYGSVSNIKYRFSITNVTSGAPAVEVIQTSRYITIPASIHLYGAAYDIKVSAVINDELVPYAGNTIRVTGPTIQLITLNSATCGATLAALSSSLTANPGLNAVSYTFRIRLNDANPAPTYAFSQSATRFVSANSFTGFPLEYGTSYKIAVQYTFTDPATNQAVESGYGTECTVNTPTIPLTTMASPTCGSQIAAMNANISATAASYATGYQFRIRLFADNGATPTYYTTPIIVSRFSSLTAFQGLALTYNTAYSISVQYSILNGSATVWSGYGPECKVTTPFFPTTSLVPSQCGLATPTSLTQQLNITPYPGFPNYKVKLEELSGEGIANSQEIVVTYPYFRLNQFAIAQLGKNYNVSVAIKLNGVFGDYSTACDLFTAAAVTKNEIATPFSVSAYPNPFASGFNLDVKASGDSLVNVKVYDMIGRLVEQREVPVSDLGTITFGAQYPSGVYNMVITQGEEIKTLRVIKR